MMTIKLIGIVAFISLFTMSLVVRTYDFQSPKLEVIFLDVGQGDSILITTVTGKQVLIDGGAHPDLDVKLSKYLKFYDRSIDVVIATHPDLDHIGGLTTVLDRFKVSTFLYSGLHSGISAYQQLTNALITSDIAIVTAEAGQVIHLDKDTYLEVVSPYSKINTEEPNEKSVSVRLVYGNTSLLLTGDASKFNEYDMVSVYGKELTSDIVKLGHHGSKTSSSSIFLDTVKPGLAIVSAGCNNRYNHPNDDVVSRVQHRNIQMLDTCSGGDIVLTSNGDSWEIKQPH